MVLVVAVVVAITLIVLAVAYFLAITNFGIDVSGVSWGGSNSCAGLSGQTTPGFTGHNGGTASYSVTLSNQDPLSSCTIHSISATTPGFSVTGGNLPLTISAGGSATLALTIDLPSSNFSGIIELVVT
ncbi:MAG: hypothetical protein WA691_00020 [Thermoplasmata archaeon]